MDTYTPLYLTDEHRFRQQPMEPMVEANQPAHTFEKGDGSKSVTLPKNYGAVKSEILNSPSNLSNDMRWPDTGLSIVWIMACITKLISYKKMVSAFTAVAI